MSGGAARSELVEELHRALTLATRHLAVPRLHELITTSAGVDIDRVEAVALSRLADADGMRLAELARQLSVDCSTASRHAARLAGRGLACRETDPDDARAVVLTATRGGRAMISKLRREYRRVLAELLEDWSDDDVEAFVDLNRRFADDMARFTESTEPVRA